MFGLLYTIALGIGGIISGVKEFLENEQAVKRGSERYKANIDTSYTYIDRNGIRRDINTRQVADIKTDISEMCDDVYLWIGTPGIKTRNISEEKRIAEFELGRNGNHYNQTTDVYDKRYWATRGKNKERTIIHGAFYKDLNTGDIYVCREFPLVLDKRTNTYILSNNKSNGFKCKFYMNVKNGLLVRKSDTQLQRERGNNYNYLSDSDTIKFIIDFNQKQKEGGWYKGGYKYNSAKGEIINKQNFYCDDFDSTDHIRKLIEKQNDNKNEANMELNKELSNIP